MLDAVAMSWKIVLLYRGFAMALFGSVLFNSWIKVLAAPKPKTVASAVEMAAEDFDIPIPPNGVEPLETHCSFDHNSCGMVNVKDDDFDWLIGSASTPSAGTGPSRDKTGKGRYIYMKASGQTQNAVARVQSYPFKLYYPACFTFYHHMHGADMGTLKVFLNNTLLWQLSGTQGDEWRVATIPIPQPGVHRLSFEGTVGSGSRGDIAIDELRLREHYSIGENCLFSPRCALPKVPPRPLKCGFSPSAPNTFKRSIPHVIGGNTVPIGGWPWQAAIYRRGQFYCGGSLIKENWVLTAAHCVTDRNASHYRIVLGDHNRLIKEGSEQTFTGKRIIVHPSYDRRLINFDVGLIELNRKATLNNRVGIVCLPQANVNVAVGRQCYITGWGKIRHPGNSHHILQQALLPVVASAACNAKVQRYAPAVSRGLRITPQMICGGEPGTNKIGCHGDSGGPYVCEESNGAWVQHGVVSWGSPNCRVSELYSVFSRVSMFRTWIDAQIGS